MRSKGGELQFAISDTEEQLHRKTKYTVDLFVYSVFRAHFYYSNCTEADPGNQAYMDCWERM